LDFYWFWLIFDLFSFLWFIKSSILKGWQIFILLDFGVLQILLISICLPSHNLECVVSIRVTMQSCWHDDFRRWGWLIKLFLLKRWIFLRIYTYLVEDFLLGFHFCLYFWFHLFTFLFIIWALISLIYNFDGSCFWDLFRIILNLCFWPFWRWLQESFSLIWVFVASIRLFCNWQRQLNLFLLLYYLTILLVLDNNLLLVDRCLRDHFWLGIYLLLGFLSGYLMWLGWLLKLLSVKEVDFFYYLRRANLDRAEIESGNDGFVSGVGIQVFSWFRSCLILLQFTSRTFFIVILAWFLYFLLLLSFRNAFSNDLILPLVQNHRLSIFWHNWSWSLNLLLD